MKDYHGKIRMCAAGKGTMADFVANYKQISDSADMVPVASTMFPIEEPRHQGDPMKYEYVIFFEMFPASPSLDKATGKVIDPMSCEARASHRLPGQSGETLTEKDFPAEPQLELN